MPTTLLQAAVGAGKTEATLQRLTETISDVDKPFAKVWVLLATKRQEVAFRQRLIDLQDARSIYFNAEFFNFYELNARLLNLQGNPQRRINEPARIGLLRHIVLASWRDGDLKTFSSIAHTPGFVRVLADLIYELKQNLVDPAHYLENAITQKDHELAILYKRYQDTLQKHKLVDREGEGWLAMDAAREDTQLATDVDLMLVDGYDQFTMTQARLLAWLSLRIPELVITLTQPPGKSDDDPQRTIGRRFIEAASRLKKIHEEIGADFREKVLTKPIITRHDDLLALGRNIFSNTDAIPATGGIQLIEAPEPAQEVAAVLRDVKAKLLAGVRPDDILIALRDWQRYHTFFAMYQRLYDLPLLLHYGTPMATNPAIVMLMRVLSLSGSDPDAPTAFRRRDLLDVLRSPYIQAPGFDDAAIALLDRISHEKRVLAGRDNWLQAIDSAGEDYYDEDGDLYPAITDSHTSADLSLALEDFFRHITPPERATLLAYVTWLENLIGPDSLEHPEDDPEEAIQPHQIYSLNIPQAIRAIDDATEMERFLNRDVAALNQFKELLGGMLITQDFLRSTLKDEPAPMYWRDLYASLKNGLANERTANRNPIRSGRVLVTTATDARGLPHDHVYILGLSEGIFPAEVPENPLYLRSEIEALRGRGVIMQTPDERADDNGIFYELISLPRQTLTLSRPTVQDGKNWVESHLWRMTQRVFEALPITRLNIGDVVPPTDVTSLDEAVLTVADGLSNGTLSTSDEGITIYRWLVNDSEQRDYWQHIAHGRATEATRLSRSAHDAYSGRLQHPDLIEIVATDFINERHIWSASQMGEFGMCPYRFFAKRLLKLDALDEPQEGLDALQLGSLNHKILEVTYNEIIDADLTIEPQNRADALDILHHVADEWLVKAPEVYKFRESALWQQEQQVIKRRLHALVEMDFSPAAPLNKGAAPRRPFALELKFGYMGENAPPVRIPLAEGQTILVRGSIDRVDLIGDDELIVVDYKSGSTPISINDMESGRHFQMMVYLLALEQMLVEEGQSQRITAGAFWHIRNLKLSGKVEKLAGEPQAAAIVAAGQHFMTENIARARAGQFDVQPTKLEDGKCSRYCDFYQLCRLANTHQYKQA